VALVVHMSSFAVQQVPVVVDGYNLSLVAEEPDDL